MVGVRWAGFLYWLVIVPVGWCCLVLHGWGVVLDVVSFGNGYRVEGCGLAV